MSVIFSAVHFQATDKLQKFAIDEFNKLSKFYNNKLDGDIVLKDDGGRKVVELRLQAYGKFMSSKIEGADFYKTIPEAVDKLKKQLLSNKSKITDR